ncbi:MAG TPA: hypothetical protein VMX13_12555 [Sedimentisphaerales bacterium]|nr:hypothetical protein [Sedimentisphaerales bacterium]
MGIIGSKPDISGEIQQFVRRDFSPSFGRLQGDFKKNPSWQRLREIGSEFGLDNEDIDSFTQGDLIDFFAEHGCADVLVRRSKAQIETSTTEGKIPKLENWRDALAGKSIGLDSLMNLAGLRSFATDQKAMDDRVRQVLARAKQQ